MIRRLFTVLSALSLLLTVATVVLWVWSYRGKTELEFQRRDGRWAIVSESGRLSMGNAPQVRLERK